ncbi:1-aminocyclopropane-1-carboxylate deaminase/D-cysteine desulfhydrase [Roseivirga echinicomitans]|uniref:1-aminocyclopropane-1-carboxylate deaminase n=1 Tax=Roseivirga echinicomitans TaxID=296218 RepID=A0A150XXJ3_9BACT|nr:pyridoxal-phosphate dependent enzyme [Roseivirga echinicomitans]KYG83416.1 1-aminocyclopropane-1-carboxylate deaminase [Roseivirga echinicomitans]
MQSLKTPIQEIRDPLLDEKGIKFLVKRDDLNHPVVSGNKFRKLKYNLEQAKLEGRDTLLTFGGAFSNHIYAVAGAGASFGFKTIGVIRGEAHETLNPTLAFAQSQGMYLHYMDRESYRRKSEPEILEQLESQFGKCYILPEGGTNGLAIKGCVEIISEVDQDFDVITCPVGTGGTVSGLIAGLNGTKRVIGFSALKGDFLKDEVYTLLEEVGTENLRNWSIQTDYHFGGYAKVKPDLISFIQEFERAHNIPLEPIYTGKMFYGLFDMIRNDFFEKGTVIMALHTGGLQGNAGFDFRA